MAKKFQILYEFSRGLAGISLINLWYFGHNFGTRNARKYIKSSKAVVFNLFCTITPLQELCLKIGPLPIISVLSENSILLGK